MQRPEIDLLELLCGEVANLHQATFSIYGFTESEREKAVRAV